MQNLRRAKILQSWRLSGTRCKNAKLSPGEDLAIVASVWDRVPVSIYVSCGSVRAIRHRDARRQISMSRGHARHRSSPVKV